MTTELITTTTPDPRTRDFVESSIMRAFEAGSIPARFGVEGGYPDIGRYEGVFDIKVTQVTQSLWECEISFK